MAKALSLLVLDMGAKYTGIMSYTCDESSPLQKNVHFGTLVLPTDGDGFTYSMTNRRMNRHRVRSKKRFKLARRLLIAIVREKMRQTGIVPDEKTQKKLDEALSGLLKRRGYSRIEAEADMSPLEETDPDFFSRILAENGIGGFSPYENIRDQWERLAQDPDIVASLKDACSTVDVKVTFKPEKGNPDSKIRMAEAKDAFMCLKNAANSVVMLERMGHKRRSDYFKAIRREIEQDKRLDLAIRAFGDKERFWRVVCNISNLQLRAQRWYFDAPEREGFYFDEKHLKKTIIRAYRYFHPEAKRKDSFRNLMETLKHSGDILDTLATLDAEKTIPPYEDQNNRRPPLDQTLLLNPAALTKWYGATWQIWVNNLMKAEPKMADALDEILRSNDRRSARPVKTAEGWKVPDSHSKEKIRATYILRRFLDRSMAIDPYAIRRLVQSPSSQTSMEARARLEKSLGSQHMDAFLEMASRYYDEIGQARSGLWSPSDTALMERSDLHPPMLCKVRKELVGNILGTNINIDEFTGNVWPTIASICQMAEKRRKDLGNAFNDRWQAMISRFVDGVIPDDENTADLTEMKSLKRMYDQIGNASQMIGDMLHLDAKQIDRFRNPFSFAQLYNIMEGQRHGFTKTCYAVHAENTWRMQSRMTDEQEGATCVRLAADTVRPFDGFVRRTLDRTAWELAKMKAEEIRTSGVMPEKLEILCLVEQNRFAYTASLADIKNMSAKKKKKLENELERNDAKWMGKVERIKADSQGICPYTGQSLDEKGEIDHILPRSMTRDINAAIFNSEVNLIYCSREGNQRKGSIVYTLTNLDKTYLQKQFGTSDVTLIRQKIEEVVAGIRQSDNKPKLDLLTGEQRRALRHALFIEGTSPAKTRAMEWFGARNSTLVNGTQAYMIQAFRFKLLDLLKDWMAEKGTDITFSTHQIPAEEVRQLRQKLGEVRNDAQKTRPQPVASHAVDALCVYAVATADNQLCKKLGESGKLYSLEDLSELVKRLPQQCDIIRVARKPFGSKTDKASTPLFDAGMYAEHFVPLYWSKGKAYAGFHLISREGDKSGGNRVEITGKKPETIFEWLAPFAEKPVICGPDNHAVLKVSKKKVFDWMSSPESLQNEPLRKLLDSLCYVTVKIPVISGFLQDKGKYRTKAEREKKLTAKAFTVKLNYKTKDKLFSFKGELVLPVYQEWQKIHALDSLAGELDDQKAFVALRDYFIGDRPKSRPHAGTRRVWSLPMIPSSQKGSMQIGRKSFTGDTVYQRQLIHGAIIEGFSIGKDKEIQWKKPALPKVYKEAVYVGQSNHDKILPLDLWLTIYRDENIVIEVSPGSMGRANIRIQQSFHDFVKMVASLCDIHIDSPLQIPSELKVPKEKLKLFQEFLPERIRNKFSQIRDKSKLEMFLVGKTVGYSYIEQNTKVPLRQLYQEVYRKQCDI